MSVFEQREEWLIGRTKGLGGTDAAAIVGMSPWRRPIDVFVSKTQGTEFGEDVTEAMEWGNLLEPVIRSRYARLASADIAFGSALSSLFPSARSLACGPDQTILRSADHDWMMGTPDGIHRNAEGGLEIKNCGHKTEVWGKEGTEEIPDHYTVQVQWYMGVTDRPWWDVAVLFSGNKMAVYRLHRNEDLIRELVAAGEQFWNDHVLKGVPPPIDSSDSYARYLARKYSLGSGTEIQASPEIEKWTQALKEAQGHVKFAEETAQLAKNTLAELLGDAGGSKTSLGRVGWVRPKPGAHIDWELLAKSLSPTPDQIENYTIPTQPTPYLRAWFTKG